MVEVRTTPTATDKLEEVRKLNLEIAKLTSTKDTAATAAKTAQNAAESATKRAEGIKTVLDALEASQAGAAAEIREFVEQAHKILQDVTAIMEEAATQARELEQKVIALCAEIEKQTTNLNEILEMAGKEGSELSRKRDDLEIWHERILTAAARHLPPGTKIEI